MDRNASLQTYLKRMQKRDISSSAGRKTVQATSTPKKRLNVSETFNSLLGNLVVDPALGLVSPSWRARGDLEVPLGITDVPWSSAVSTTASTCRGRSAMRAGLPVSRSAS